METVSIGCTQLSSRDRYLIHETQDLFGNIVGGVASPILANIYLHELEEKIEEIRQRIERGGQRKKVNPLHKNLSARKLRLVKKGATRTKEFRELVRQIRNIPAVQVNDPNFIRLKYLRYADDWIIGICGPQVLAEQVKEELKTFLNQHLKLTQSEEKTKSPTPEKNKHAFWEHDSPSEERELFADNHDIQWLRATH